MRGAFLFYDSFYEAAKVLNDEDRLALYDSIIEFGLNQTETEMKPMVKAFFSLIKPQLQANYRKYENGKKGGRPSETETETKPNNNLNKTETKANKKEKEKENENENDKESKKTHEQKPPRFSPPSLQEIQEYVSEKKMNVNAETFYFFYEAKGWRIGRDSMKSWTAALAQWNSRETQNSKTNEEQEWR